MMKSAWKLYTQLVPFLPPDEDTAARTMSCVQYLAGEIAPPSGVTTFQAHRGHYLESNLSRSKEKWSQHQLTLVQLNL